MEVNGVDPDVHVLSVPDSSAVGAARRTAVAAAERAGCGEGVTGRVALVATELATNLVRHGGGGTFIVQEGRADLALELLAVDRGPGIANLGDALRDGFSTAGTGGTGLGAVGRIADQADIFSAAGVGTIVLARFGGTPSPSTIAAITVGGLSVPHPSESTCGDAWSVHRLPDQVALLVADGLGHGEAAAIAAREAVRVFRDAPGVPPGRVLEDAHAALRHTRGAALGLAVIRPREGILVYAGVGNISGTVIRSGESKSLVSHAGIVGHQCHKIQEFTYPWGAGATLVLHSDGLQSRWQLSRYTGIAERHPTILSAALYRDHVRGRDDVTVVAVREAA
jgi:anti-sigma regulatory factor (Ser/Thr protein kinase)